MKYLLSDICDMQSGGTPRRGNEAYYDGIIPWVKISDLDNEGAEGIIETEEYITDEGLNAINHRIFEKGTLLLAMYGSVGKTAIAGTRLSANQAILGITVKRPDIVAIDYLRYWFDFNKDKLVDQGRGATLTNISATIVKRQEVELPDLTTQRQIVIALDKTKGLINRRLKELEMLDKLERNLFLHRFQRFLITDDNEFQRLDQIAIVVSGITKGRKTRGDDLKEIPYLRVANVQDGYFDLSEIKTIEATSAEIERYRIEKGDLLLTEGGDRDKLGRGNVWMEDETDFIFQNHLFRVRIIDQRNHRPSFLKALTGSDFGRAYFRKQAKQTTGIASINSRQMKAFPIPIVPTEEQVIFEQEVDVIESIRGKLKHSSLPELETLFQSLLQRAFHGDLTIDPDLQLDGYLENENFKAIAADTVLIQTLIDRFNQAKTDALSEVVEEDGEEESKSFRFEAEASYNRAKDALFHLLKEGLVTQKTPEKEEEPFKTYLITT